MICVPFLPSVVHPQPSFLGTGWRQLGVGGNRADLWDRVLSSRVLGKGLSFSLRPLPALNPTESI